MSFSIEKIEDPLTKEYLGLMVRQKERYITLDPNEIDSLSEALKVFSVNGK